MSKRVYPVVRSDRGWAYQASGTVLEVVSDAGAGSGRPHD